MNYIHDFEFELEYLFGNFLRVTDVEGIEVYISQVGRVVDYAFEKCEVDRVCETLERFKVSHLKDRNKVFIFFKEGAVQKMERVWHEKFCKWWLGVEKYKPLYDKQIVWTANWTRELLQEQIDRLETQEDFAKRILYNWNLLQLPPCLQRIYIDGEWDKFTQEEKRQVYATYKKVLEKNGYVDETLWSMEEEVEPQYNCKGVLSPWCKDGWCEYKTRKEGLPVVCMQGGFCVEGAWKDQWGNTNLRVRMYKTGLRKDISFYKGDLANTRMCIRMLAQQGIRISENLPDRCWDDFMAYVNENRWNDNGKETNSRIQG